MAHAMTDEYIKVLDYAYSVFGTYSSFTAKDIHAKAPVINALFRKGFIKRTMVRGPWKVTDEGEDYCRKYCKKQETVESDWNCREVFDGPVY